ncbi:MAG: PQQ-dependent sugar dehydrogenase [Verrucomicrobia bacterium]|nr:PQQ-dependent sugar dehydrogenase [Verrucomicrobiota bacterium]
MKARLLAVALLGPLACAAEPAGDTHHGQALFQQTCALCHGAQGGQGPNLAGVVGRKAGSAPNFGYTSALTASDLTWDGATLDRYLANPAALVPGTNMVVQVPAPADRRDLIAYLATLKAPAGPASRRPSVDPAASDAHDWRRQHPGAKYAISADHLPPPYNTSAPSNGPRVVAPPAGATLAVPAGFKVELFAKNLNGGRIVRVAPNGDIFIAETRANRIRVLRAPDGAAAPTEDTLFATGLDRPFGIAFYPAGPAPQWVYVANNNSVVRFPYRSGDLTARGPAETIVPRLSETTNGHSTRDLAFSPDGQRLFISVGSGSNVAENLPAKTPAEIEAWEKENALGAAWGSEAHRANVLVTSPDGRAPLKIFATGTRNPVSLALEPVNGALWTSANERDGLGDDLVPDYVTSLQEGAYYGWPWYYLGNHEDPRLKNLRPDLAGKATVPDVLIQAHSAALGITFYTAQTGASLFPAEYRGDLFVALHGSWNRNSRTGYCVIRVRLHDGKPTGEYEDFLTGFVADGRSVWGRPVGVAVAHDGALLVTEDGNGTLWRVSTVR